MTTAWKNSTATERRAARLAAAERERGRKPQRASRITKRVPIPVATDTTGWSEWCEEASHTLCPRLLTCRCPCHDRRAD